jgi:folate-binding protein YgfZ
MPQALLNDRAVLLIEGADAESFLQGMTTNDVRRARAKEAVFTAFLSPQGKFLHDGFLIRTEDGFWLEMDKARLPELKKRLSFHKLRARVTLQEKPEWQVAACWEAMPVAFAFADPRLRALGHRLIGEHLEGDASHQDYERLRLREGVPEGAKDLIFDRSLILDYGYDRLNGVDFAKGCYVGQEVTIRTKHRATLRKYLHCVEGEGDLPPAGSPVLREGKTIGAVCSGLEGRGLAHLDAEQAALGGLSCEGVALRAALPKWAEGGK